MFLPKSIICEQHINSAKNYVKRAIGACDDVNKNTNSPTLVNNSIHDILNKAFTFKNSDNISDSLGNINCGLKGRLSTYKSTLESIKISEQEDYML